ncbi:beta-galactosidase [Paenibacillus donghaensis]|uniref:Glycosyl hydrolase family 35 n=1 Tax=Paenibacillus donghaensis TaxID=414771 RepID=A0A2Z2KAL5_9BACL|nr:beta-galactosidase [Paenibacillus donghaensis]ASA19843.1 glycosyl hydrolase family 35 [Paenibacillus donghaensis]
MKNYRIVVSEDKKNIFSGHMKLGGVNPSGERISFTNYYMEKNGDPFFGICGEFHFSRYDERYWEDEIIKMKMGGVNIVTTYIFWNLHEEVEGVFEWKGNKDLRTFIQLCDQHGLYVMIRIGPFCHGEIRNGGMPEWLFGRPFEVRSNDEGYMVYVRRLYAEISLQVQGLLYKDGGPVIGTQIENEHNHSSAQWGLTVGVNNMWLSGGSDGNAHMLQLKDMALEAGIDTPIYTCTGWGGATTPVPDMLPLWGGYAYWPWIYYETDRFEGVKEHPATPEYIFRDKHNNAIPKSYNFEPFYSPEDYPYACCEMGGGMVQFYKYRFEFPYNSVPAMSVMKTAEGCNILGYYMYHGGSNPKGKVNLFTNDLATPKISYDFNAMIGEFGQVRESYKRTKLQHYLFTEFQNSFALTKTILPGDTSENDPYEVDTLRYAVRSHEGAGFLFLNNFQDHVDNHDLQDMNVSIELPGETITIPGQGELTLGSESFAILPYNFDLAGITLKYATAQLITKLDVEDVRYYFFFTPEGMKGTYALQTDDVTSIEVDYGHTKHLNHMTIIEVDEQNSSIARLVSAEGKKVVIYTMTSEQSLEFWKADIRGKQRVLFTNANLLVSGNEIKLESTDQEEVTLRVFPDFEDSLGSVSGGKLAETSEDGLFKTYKLLVPKKEIICKSTKVKNERAVLEFESGSLDGVKEALLQIDYSGDIGYAFIDGDLIHDNFCNTTTWEIGLKRFEEQLLEKGMYLYVSPIRKGTVVNSNTTMAGWNETATELIADIASIRAVPVYEIVIRPN